MLQEPGLESFAQHWAPLEWRHDLARHWLQTGCQRGPAAVSGHERVPHSGGLPKRRPEVLLEAQIQQTKPTCEMFPQQVIDGWPCISESLKWAGDCPLYLMGQYTALQVGVSPLQVSLMMSQQSVPRTKIHFLSQVGPHAVNLAGGQAASMRISRDIMQRLQADNTEAAQPTGKARTEEYIQQMKGLLWL